MIVLLLIAQSWTAYLDSSLYYIGLTRQDLTFRNDYTIRDEYRFTVVDRLLNDPVRTVDVLQKESESFWAVSNDQLIRNVLRYYDLPSNDLSRHSFDEVCTNVAMLVNTACSVTPPELRDVFQELTLFSPELTTSIEEDRAKEKRRDSLVQYLKENAATINYAQLFQAGADLLCATMYIEEWLDDIPLDTGFQIPGVGGTVVYHARYEWGEIIVGDTSTNVYSKDFAVIIDLGGDDVYKIVHPHTISVIIDTSGDDAYVGGDFSVGSGTWGIAILIDKQGDDTYQAGNYSLGCGVFGIGVLIDEAGSDSYYGDTFTQGAGGFGIGILKDQAGNDRYEGALYAQGFASTYGIGILGDGAGNDMYVILEKYIDEIRYLDHYLSLSQGFSMGFRPDLSAGVGLMFERDGNDYYLGDIFAQGSSYWYGIGGIVDGGGNDTYIAYQYAQGAGTHITIGALVDMAGNDNYVSKGVSQGCGHDLSLGILYDLQGDDSYVAFDLSQGAGNANGIGILVDEEGDDSYSVKRSHNTQGYGNWRREYGSIGVLVDIHGDDNYRDGEDHCVWKNGEYGVGIDFE